MRGEGRRGRPHRQPPRGFRPERRGRERTAREPRAGDRRARARACSASARERERGPRERSHRAARRSAAGEMCRRADVSTRTISIAKTLARASLDDDLVTHSEKIDIRLHTLAPPPVKRPHLLLLLLFHARRSPRLLRGPRVGVGVAASSPPPPRALPAHFPPRSSHASPRAVGSLAPAALDASRFRRRASRPSRSPRDADRRLPRRRRAVSSDASADDAAPSSSSSLSPLLDNVCFVLCRPQGPQNIGAIARVMNNFGVTDLRIVTPEASALAPPSTRATRTIAPTTPRRRAPPPPSRTRRAPSPSTRTGSSATPSAARPRTKPWRTSSSSPPPPRGRARTSPWWTPAKP